MDLTRMNQETAALSDPYTNEHPLCFIHRLPIDTLQSIFIECASDHFGKDGYRVLSTAPHWVNISYVSRYWRNVALNCPTLWTYLFILSPRWTEELLARSEQASLKIYVHLDFPSELELGFVDQVLNHVERIQELRVLFVSSEDADRFISKLSSPAPRLRHLAILHVRYYAGGSSPRARAQLPFNGDTPALRTLELTWHSLQWDRLNPSGLTHLSLRDSPRRQNFTDFLAMLRGMQNLRSLHLEHALASATGFISSSAFHSFQKINLPHLSKFYLCAPLSTATAMVSCTNIPLTTSLKLQSHLGTDFEDSSSFDHLAPFCHSLAERYAILQHQTQTLPRIRSLVITDTLGGVEFSMDAVATIFSFDSLLRQAWDNDLLRISLSTHYQDEVVTSLLDSLPLSTVQSIHINKLSSPMALSSWTSILKNLPGLRYLKLSDCAMPNLVPILSPAPHSPLESRDREGEQSQSEMLVPALELLELDKVWIPASLTSMPISPKVTTVQSLLRVLSTRKLRAQGRLTLTRCVYRVSKWETKLVDLKASWENGYWGMLLYKEDLVFGVY